MDQRMHKGSFPSKEIGSDRVGQRAIQQRNSLVLVSAYSMNRIIFEYFFFSITIEK